MSYYGTPRATRNYAASKTIAPQICLCLECATYAYNPEHNGQLRGSAFNEWLQDVDYRDVVQCLEDGDEEDFVDKVNRGKVIDNSLTFESKPLLLLCEGQLDEQIYLDNYHCRVCDVRLHKLCVDY